MNDKIQSPLKSIRAKCLDCSCGSSYEVERCTIERCPLYPYRFGKNPNIQLSPEEKARRQAVGREVQRKLQELRKKASSEGKDTTVPI